MILPRDAWQQAEVGRAAGIDVSRWDAGDLLFFSERADGRITHVGIALGQGRMVDAPHTGALVRVEPIAGFRGREHYLGATRPAGATPPAGGVPSGGRP